MINHIVMFSLKGTDDERKEYAGRFRDAILSLPEKIPGLKGVDVHLNENPCENYDLMIHARFDSHEDLVTYSLHPDHLEAVGVIKTVIDSRACIDYNTEE
ncbi:MAG: Dabb family protein [Bacteroides sp.]|nr:Dabb family protein [Bacteroides sp.]